MSKIKDALKRAKMEQERGESFALLQEPVLHSEHKVQTRVVDYFEAAVIRHKIITPYFDNQELIEQFKLLRTKILLETQERDNRTILITSALEQEGKTFISINLAITFAREVDQTVLLVDVNLKKPSVLKCFGIEQEKGLTDYLLNNEPLPTLLVRPGIEKLTILPSGLHSENSAEALRSQKMKQLVKEMKERYSDRYIFFDAPSVLNSVDAMVLSEYVDKTLFVIESGRIKPQQVSEALSRLDKSKLLGTILNKRIE
jgi:protein-tyrosine kinase